MKKDRKSRILWKKDNINRISELSVHPGGKLILTNTNLKQRTVFPKFRESCIISGRKTAVFTKFGLSRFYFRTLADQGYLPGIRRSSW